MPAVALITGNGIDMYLGCLTGTAAPLPDRRGCLLAFWKLGHHVNMRYCPLPTPLWLWCRVAPCASQPSSPGTRCYTALYGPGFTGCSSHLAPPLTSGPSTDTQTVTNLRPGVPE